MFDRFDSSGRQSLFHRLKGENKNSVRCKRQPGRMRPFSKASQIQARNETAAATPTTVQSLRLKPTIIASASSQESGWRGSYSNTTSTLPYSTGFATRVSSSAPSSATPPSYYTNHSSSSLAAPSSTHMLPDLYTKATLAPSLPTPTSDLTLSTASAAPSRETDQEMSLETKVGLAMIPIAVGLCAWGLVLLILWRRRKAHQSHHRITSFSALGPEKSHSPLLASLNSSTRSRRIFTMAAFYSRDKQDMSVTRPTTPPPCNSPVERAKTDSNPDSPIDGGSPFRLRPGEARKSLGSEISELWPSPPPTAWARRQDILEQLPTSRFGRDMTVPRLKRSENRGSLRDAHDITRPSMGDNWPLM